MVCFPHASILGGVDFDQLNIENVKIIVAKQIQVDLFEPPRTY